MVKLKTNKFWQKAKKIIPGGNLLYSKRPEMFLPKYWPTYYSKSEKCFVWDLNNKKFIDMIFSVGTNVLGYNNKHVNNKIKETIDRGNLTTLNCPEEVLLAKKLISINRWADMVKFARTGGEANAIAIRIARAFNKEKQNVALCGYHGWHDWYLASNLKNKENLNSHLANNIKVAGVNKKLKDTAFVFEYNDIKRLEYLLKNKKIGIIKIEVQRTIKPKNNFLKKIKKLSKKYNAILIFDECTSGFRETYGGIYKKYKVNPDMIIYGKAIGGGYGITAVLGKRKYMQAAQETFMSSTFWTERIGFVAALATLDYMKKNKTWKKITSIGRLVKNNWETISKKNQLEIEISGILSIPQFKFTKDHNLLKTYFVKRMLEKGFLASNIIYISIAHTNKILSKYFKAVDDVFREISIIKNPKKEIKIEEAHQDFKRLN